MNRVPQSHRVELAGIGPQGDLDIAKAFAPGQLRKCHDAKLLRAAQSANPGIARVSIHNARKARPRNELHQLRKQRLADIHASPQGISPRENYTKMSLQSSNRHQAKSAVKPRQYWLSHESTPI